MKHSDKDGSARLLAKTVLGLTFILAIYGAEDRLESDALEAFPWTGGVNEEDR